MAWEKRGNHFYYYRKHRIGNRVRSEYVGHGAHGIIAEAQDAKVRHLKNESLCAGQEMEKLITDLRKLEFHLDQAEELNWSFITLSLFASGYYKHHREWRKGRW